ncbi:MAG: LysM peptidoglycan-binding domain-containing protein [Bacteroidota bacterium]
MKKIIFASFFIFFLLPAFAQVIIIHKSDIIEMRNGRSFYIHTVQKGQTVYSIAKAYDVTPDEIYFENPGTNQSISINQELLIPTVNKETELKNDVVDTNYNFFYHVAAKNETLQHISSIYLIPERYIIKANPNMHSPLREGEYVKVPVKEAFAILDGKVASRTYPQNRTKKNSNSSTYVKPKSTQQKAPKPKAKKPKSEFVSFNPDIPVIDDYRHVVILGETTKSIAEKYGIPVDVLKAANPGLGNSVAKSDRLRVPDKTKLDSIVKKQSDDKNKPQIQDPVFDVGTKDSTIVTTKPENIKHRVKKKETLYSIGREYGVSVSEILKVNAGLTPSIKIGQIIFVPKKKISKPYILHTADKNTKTNKLAKLYRVPIYQLKEFNPTIGKRIYKNDEIKIPVGRSAIIVPATPHDDVVIIVNKDDDLSDDTDENLNNCIFLPDTERIFKVALMIPLFLEETDSLVREQFLISHQKHFIPFRFIKFYEGAMIALDSLTKQGMKVELFVYDVDKNLTKTAKVLQQSELRSMDLIIGPFYNNSFNQIALFAGNFNIPIVNPLSYRESIVNNYNSVIKVKPTTYSQIQMIESFIPNYASNSKVFLISQTSYIDADMVIEINNRIMESLEPQFKMSNQKLFNLSYLVAQRDTLYIDTALPAPYVFEGTNIYPEFLETTLTDSTFINNNLIRINYSSDSLYPFLENASPIRNNLIVLYGTKKSFILDVLNRLNQSRDTFNIQLIGMPTWERISNLSNIQMNNLNLSYFSSSHINFDKESTQEFIYKFRNNYNCEPDEYAYSGFDITYYFLSSLFNLGDNFIDCLEYYPMELLKSKYHYKRLGDSNNFENDYWNMLRLNNMSIYKIPDNIILPPEQPTIDD